MSQKYGLTLQVVAIDEAYEGSEVKLQDALEACCSWTESEDLLQRVRESLLLQTAQKFKSTLLAMGDNARRLAVKSLVGVANGRGYSLPMDVGHGVGGGNKEILILR